MVLNTTPASGALALTDERPTALWVVPVASLGGVARHVLDVARVGIPGWRLVVLCPAGPLAERLAEQGAAVLTGPVDPASGPRTAAREVRDVLRRLRPAIVHGHLAFADLIVALASLGLPPAVVTTEHGIAGDDLIYHGSILRSRIRAAAHTVRLRQADALIAVSEATRAAVKAKWHPSTDLCTVVIPNGVDRPALPPQPTAGLQVCSLSRLAPEKGLSDLLEAFALVHHQHPRARLTIAGEGDGEGQLRQLARSLDLADVVNFPGHVDADEVLRHSDVLVQLSVWENCSYSLLDAVVAGLGVVATPVGGNPEILPETALVPRAHAEEVAAAIVAQGIAPSSRPQLPTGWPTIADMCEQVADLYARVISS